MKKLLLIAVVLFFAYRLVINSTGFCIDEMRVIPDEEICEKLFLSHAKYGEGKGDFQHELQSVRNHLQKNLGACVVKRNIRTLSSYPHYIKKIYKRNINKDVDEYNYIELETYINSCGKGLIGGERYVMSITEREAKEKLQHKISY